MKDTSILINNKIDYQKGIELLGDIETYDEMLEDFLDGVQDKLDKLKKYKENNTGYINDNFNDLITELNRIITVITEYINS